MSCIVRTIETCKVRTVTGTGNSWRVRTLKSGRVRTVEERFYFLAADSN